MKNYFILFILLISINNLEGQTLLSGVVLDTTNHPIQGALIWQDDFSTTTQTDINGAFHIYMDKERKQQISISHYAYKSVDIPVQDSINQPMTLILKARTRQEIQSIKLRPVKKRQASLAFLIDITFPDFDNFSDLIGSDNTDALNGYVGVFNLEFTSIRKRRAAGFNFGIIFNESNKDSIDIEIIKTHYGLNYGYRLINSRNILFTPKAGIKWYRYRLINSDSDTKITLSQHLEERDLDLRFNQATGFIGADLAFKIHPKASKGYPPNNYYTIGAYGNYLFKLHEKPLIYSKRNRLTTDQGIRLSNYNFGVFFSWNFD